MEKKYNPDSFSSHLLQYIVGLIMRTFYRPKLYYTDKSKQSAKELPHPCIIVETHKSHIDGTILRGCVFRKERIHFLAAKDRFEQNRLMNWYLSKTHCIPIDRKDFDTSWIHESLKCLKEYKEPVCIYPEGCLSPDKSILPFHNGVAMLAALSNVPVLLVYTDGPYRLFRGPRIIIDVAFMPKFPEKGRMRADVINDITMQLQARMQELQTILWEKIGKNQKEIGQDN